MCTRQDEATPYSAPELLANRAYYGPNLTQIIIAGVPGNGTAHACSRTLALETRDET